MIDWRPIDAIPDELKDGRWLLLSGGHIDYGWDGDSEPPAVVAQFLPRALPEPSWQFAWYDSGYYGEYREPTHFAELNLPE